MNEIIATGIGVFMLFFVNTVFIWGLSSCFEDGMIFKRIDNWMTGMDKQIKAEGEKRERVPLWIRKPLYTCPICMSSIWGSFIYWLGFGAVASIYGISLFQGELWWIVIGWPIYCLCLAGINTIIYNLFPGE